MHYFRRMVRLLSRKMKDSGIEWIGEIPEDWEVAKLKNFVSVSSGEYIPKEHYHYNGEFAVVGSNGIIGKTKYKNNDDEVITTGRVGTIGTVNIVKEAWITDNTLIIKPEGRISIRYLYYVFPNFDYGMISSGTAQPLITATNLKNQYFSFPSNLNQQKIANFLDEKVAEIDHILEKTRESIEEYKEYKQSIITEAVTKGLNPDVKMKDSGIEWIGEIPEHWKISKIKNLYEIVLGKMLCNERLSDDYTLENYLRAQNIKWDGINQENIKKMWFSKKEKKQYLLEKGDVVITEGGSVGVSAVYNGEESPCYIQNAVHRARGKSDNINKFLYYWMTLVVSGGYMDLICNKATIAHYTKEKLENTPISFCPVPEQISIIEYLDGKIKDFDNIIRQKEKLLIDLEAYKKSLIYECVTGKREVI